MTADIKKLTPEAPAPAFEPSEDKKFADFLGELVQGNSKGLSDELSFFAKQLMTHKEAHQETVKKLQQAEQQMAQARAEAIKLEGCIEQGISTVRHFWSKG